MILPKKKEDEFMNEEWDYIIVGAGICGLSLGALLVNDEYKVLVLEKTTRN